MKFGKLDDLSGVDFRLPPDHPQTTDVLRGPATTTRMLLGATGWGNKEWLGKWYPKGTPAGSFLHHYSRQFSTIEFNTTHYRIPDAHLVDRWYEMAAPDFKFCPKVPQQISHRSRKLSNAEEPTARFIETISGLKDKLGPIFLQLPDYHGPEDWEPLVAYLRQWPQEMPIHIEFRHPEWFTGHPDAERVFDVLAATGHGTVITDVSGRRDVLHMRQTNRTLVLRYVGNGLHPTDLPRAMEWNRRLLDWQAGGLEEAYLFLHQPEMEEVPPFATQWAEDASRVLGRPVPHPRPVGGAAQQSLF